MCPGRVNLIGEHTDYNDGLCLPIALPHKTFVALSYRDDDVVRLISDQGALWSGKISDIVPGMAQSWVNYAGGPAWSLGIERGFDAAVVSCVPLGAGLSSSAAIEAAMAFALQPPTNAGERQDLVDACIRAENEVANAPTGGMDQTVSVFANRGEAVCIDFFAHTKTHVPADFTHAGLCLLVIDTRAKHSLSDGQYGKRRAQCEQAKEELGLASLRSAELSDVNRLDGVIAQRLRHVVSENMRVSDAIAALRARDFTTLGQLFIQSHESLRDDYEVSSPELDCAVETALAHGALGARMTGGGFGGSAIALIKESDRDSIAHAIAQAHLDAGFPEPVFIVAHASSGAHLIND